MSGCGCFIVVDTPDGDSGSGEANVDLYDEVANYAARPAVGKNVAGEDVLDGYIFKASDTRNLWRLAQGQTDYELVNSNVQADSLAALNANVTAVISGTRVGAYEADQYVRIPDEDELYKIEMVDVLGVMTNVAILQDWPDTTVAVENDGVPLVDPVLTLNFDTGITATDAGGGQVDVTVAGGGSDTNLAISNLTADANRTHDFATFNQLWNNLGALNIHTDTLFAADSINVGGDEGGIDVTPTQVEINVDLASGPLGRLTIDPAAFELRAEDGGANEAKVAAIAATAGASTGEPTIAIRTAGIDDGTATVGQALTLVDTATGEVEYGSGADTNLAIANLTSDANRTHDFATFNQLWNGLGAFNLHAASLFAADVTNVGGDEGGIDITPTQLDMNVDLASGAFSKFTLTPAGFVVRAEDGGGNQARVSAIAATAGASTGEPQLAFQTAAVHDATAVADQVITLVDAATGESEFTTIVTTIENQSVALGKKATINFTGDGVVAAVNGNKIDVTIDGTGAKDEGSTILERALYFDFVGAGVTVTDGGSDIATVTIPGGAGSDTHFLNTNLTSASTGALWQHDFDDSEMGWDNVKQFFLTANNSALTGPEFYFQIDPSTSAWLYYEDTVNDAGLFNELVIDKARCMLSSQGETSGGGKDGIFDISSGQSISMTWKTTAAGAVGAAFIAKDTDTENGRPQLHMRTDACVQATASVGQVATLVDATTGEFDWDDASGASPLTTKGDVFTYDTGDQRLAVGTNGQVLSANSAQATGLEWIDAPSGASPLTTKGDLFTYDSDDQRLAIGTNDQVLTADSTEATGMKWADASANDSSAIHDDTASEISALTLVTVASGDHLLIEDASDSNNKKRIAASDFLDAVTVAAYAQIETEGNATATTISSSSTDFSNKVQVTTFSADNATSADATPDHTNDHIEIGTDGDYDVELSVSLSGGSNDTISGALFKNNGATQLTPRFTRKLGTGGDIGHSSISGLVALSDGDTVEFWVQNESSTADVTCEDMALLVKRVDASTTAGGGSGGLTISTSTPNTNITAVVGTLNVVTMSSMTADRDWVLPTTAAVGDRCGISIVDGDPEFEFLIKSGASGDLIQNVDHSTNEWSRVFIAGERVVMECIDAAGPHWQVADDGRIPCKTVISRAAVQSLGANTDIDFDTSVYDVGDLADIATNFRIDIRRDGFVDCKASMRTEAITANNAVWMAIRLNGASHRFVELHAAFTSRVAPSVSDLIEVSADDYLELRINTPASVDSRTSVDERPKLSVHEQL